MHIHGHAFEFWYMIRAPERARERGKEIQKGRARNMCSLHVHEWNAPIFMFRFAYLIFLDKKNYDFCWAETGWLCWISSFSPRDDGLRWNERSGAIMGKRCAQKHTHTLSPLDFTCHINWTLDMPKQKPWIESTTRIWEFIHRKYINLLLFSRWNLLSNANNELFRVATSGSAIFRVFFLLFCLYCRSLTGIFLHFLP